MRLRHLAIVLAGLALTGAAVPSRLAVDENDRVGYSLIPSYLRVAAGTVRFNVYNYGGDDHTFAIVAGTDWQSGQRLADVTVPAHQPGTAVPVSADLAPG